MVANIVFFVVSEHASCGSVDKRSSRNASLKYFATAKFNFKAFLRAFVREPLKSACEQTEKHNL